MIRIILILLALIPTMAAAAEQNPKRREALLRVERSYILSSLMMPESPFVDLILSSARQANPSTQSETWNALRKDFAFAIYEADTRAGGPMSPPLRIALSELTDTEIERVSVILEDPAFKHFQAVTGSRAHIQQIVNSILTSGSIYNSAINSVLLKHGLNVNRQDLNDVQHQPNPAFQRNASGGR